MAEALATHTRPFRPIDHRAGSLPGCMPGPLPPGRPAAQAYASVMVGVRDINALLMQHQLLLWTNTTYPHVVVCVGLPSREIERIKSAGSHSLSLSPAMLTLSFYLSSFFFH